MPRAPREGATPGPADPRLALVTLLANLLDATIAVYAVAFVAAITIGGFDFGIVSATTVAKPALALMLLVPTRLAVGKEGWLLLVWTTIGDATREWSRARLPPAIQDAAFALVVTRVPALTIALLANVLLLPEGGATHAPLPWAKLTETLAVFDSAWYLDIAYRGYSLDSGREGSIAFFPLYPLLIRLVAAPFGGSVTALWGAAIVVSWTAFAAALVALHQLTDRLTGDRETARRTILYIAVFPFSFYFSQVYTEGLFLLWTVRAVSAASDSKWMSAGTFGALATLTRPNGILIALPLLMMALSRLPAGRVLKRRLLALTPIPLALVAYSAYLYSLTGTPLAWLEAQRHWGYTLGNLPHRHLLNTLLAVERHGLYASLIASDTAAIDLFYTTVALIFLALVPAVIRRFGTPMGTYVLMSVAIPLSGNVLVGMGRYASVLFPVFMLAGTVASERAHHAILIVSALLFTLFLVLFVGWRPLH